VRSAGEDVTAAQEYLAALAEHEFAEAFSVD
jgi:hypothetical protein